MAAEGMRQCPFCMEEIDAAATKCKFCCSQVKPARPAHGGTCPFCKEQIHPEALVCKHCRSSLRQADDCSCSRPALGHTPAAALAGARVTGQCSTWCVGSTLMCACPVRVPGMGNGVIIYACGTCIDDPVLTA